MLEAESTARSRPALPPQVTRLLVALRKRIRWYVAVEGLGLLVAWLGLSFWVGMAADYLPVMAGSSEMPPTARALLLAVIGVVALGIAWRWILQRIFRPLPDRSMAVLVERSFPEFQDSLVTAVELRAQPAAATPLREQMLAVTMDLAERQSSRVPLGTIFNHGPLLRSLAAAALVGISLVLGFALARDALTIWSRRLYLLSDQTWPRRADIEVVGFPGGVRKVAKGSDVQLRVRARADADRVIPTTCTIYFRTADGARGRLNMSRDGEPREGYQHFVFSGAPFQGVLDDIVFDVVGFDDRIRDLRLQVVLSPVVARVQLDCQLPAYTQLLPRRLDWVPGTSLPIGSRINLRLQSSKPLRRASLEHADTGDRTEYRFEMEAGGSRREFSYQVDRLEGDLTLLVHLEDTDGIASQQPYGITIQGLVDQPPQVNVGLRGIGSAITPDARIPVTGSILDDYEVQRCWFQLAVANGAKRTFPLTARRTDQGAETEPYADARAVDDALDLRDARSAGDDPLTLQPGQEIGLLVQASDHYDLDDDPHVGSSEAFPLAVVRPDELLALLDGRELNLRRRLEQVKSEMLETRDSLVRLVASWKPATKAAASDTSPGDEREGPPAAGTDPDPADRSPDAGAREAADTAPQTESPADSARVRENVVQSRQRWLQWSRQQAEHATQETIGIAASFEDIHLELVNNRVDTPERESRLIEQIITPLNRITDQMFPALAATLPGLAGKLDQAGEPDEARLSINQVSQILLAIDQVLEKMQQLEDYAELVNIVRSIITEQERLLQQTQEEQKKRVLDLLR
jgi:hypothetical protein